MRTRIFLSKAGESSTPRVPNEALTRRQALRLTAAPFLLSAWPRAARAEESSVVTLPATADIGGRPTVLARVRGHELRFLVDTGSTRSVLDRTIADQIALDLRRTNVTARGIAGPLPVELAVQPGMELDGLPNPRAHKQLWVLASGGLGPGIAGLLGNEFLWDWDVEFDLPNSALRFYPRGTGSLPDGARSTRLRHSDRYRAIVQVELDGVVLRALLDSGAAFSSVARRALYQLGIDANDGNSVHVGTTRGIGGHPVLLENRRFRRFALEDETLDAPRFAILNDNPEQRMLTGSHIVTETDHEFVLGADWLNTHRVLLSPSEDRLSFLRVGNNPIFRVPVPARSG
jgi:predicted aspartyl protease